MRQSKLTKYSYREFSFLKGILLPGTKFIKLPFLQLLDVESMLFYEICNRERLLLMEEIF